MTLFWIKFVQHQNLLSTFLSLSFHTICVDLNYFFHLVNPQSLWLVHLKHSSNHLFYPVWNLDVWREMNLLFHSFCQRNHVIGFFPRVNIVKHLVEYNSQTPNIAFYCVRLSQKDLRRHINGCSYTWLKGWIGLLFLVFYNFCKSKVRQFKLT